MYFENSYYEDEVKEGFYVPGLMKSCWAAQLQVLKEISRICRKYGLSYFIDWGTLIGGIRHEGFIPWDDDLDIVMKRADLNIFRSVAKGELPENYVVVSVHEDDENNNLQQVYRIVNSHSISNKKEYLINNNYFPFVAGVDIFCLDNVPDDDSEAELLYKLIKYCDDFEYALVSKKISEQDIADYATGLKKLTNYTIDISGNVQAQLNVLKESLYSLYAQDQTKYLTFMPAWVATNRTFKLPQEYYKTVIYKRFENVELPVPIAYDRILQNEYGEYIKSVKGAAGHGYPYYKDYKKMLQNAVGRERYELGEKAKDYYHNITPRALNTNSRNNMRKVVFISAGAKYWQYFDSIYKAAIEDDTCKVYVVNASFSHKTPWGDLLEVIKDSDMFPEYVRVVEDIDLEKMHPEMIFFQNPYDEYNFAMEIERDYFSSRLRLCTEKLIYIPSFALEEKSILGEAIRNHAEYFINVPGIYNADMIFLQSENMKRLYLETLMGFVDSLIVDEISEKIHIYEGHNGKKSCNKKGLTLKKNVMFSMDVSAIVTQCDGYIKHIRDFFKKCFENKDKIYVVWSNGADLEDFLLNNYYEIYEKYIALLDEFFELDIGEYMPNISQGKLLEKCDMYYGDAGRMAYLFSEKEKPVVLIHCENIRYRRSMRTMQDTYSRLF